MAPPGDVKRISRENAIDRLRKALLHVVDDEHSICMVAAEKGIFCRGFAKYTDEELELRYRRVMRSKPNASREEIEREANRWQLMRQLFDEVPFACDAQQREHDTCGGWDEFTNEDLARFCHDILGQELIIT